MTDKFRHKYRIPSARASWWDYNNIALYFITICTKNREHFFGEIVSESQTPCMASLRATEIGRIAEQEWLKTPALRPDMNLVLDEFVIMPNHFHAIIQIGKNDYNRPDGGCRDAMHGVSAEHSVSTDDEMEKIMDGNKFGPQSKNLSSIVRGYKSAVTTYARKNNIAFSWQSRFHDHIIRNEKSYQRIKNYILNNPKNWKDDIFYTD